MWYNGDMNMHRHTRDEIYASHRRAKRRAVARMAVWLDWIRAWDSPRQDGYSGESARSIGLAARTPQRCSCVGCGNQRRWVGLSRQEKRAKQDAEVQVRDAFRYGWDDISLDIEFGDPWYDWAEFYQFFWGEA